MGEPKTILIIDDDSDFVAATGDLLRSAGHAVHSAAGGPAGIRLARALLPDLILLDVMMSERTEGIFTLQELRRLPALASTPVIVVSSLYTENPAFHVDPAAGWMPADQFLPKPVDPARLLQEVDQALPRSTPASTRRSR